MTHESSSKTYSFFSVVTLLLLTLIIGNLIHNIQYLDIPPETRLPYPEIGGGEAAVFDVNDNGEGMRWVLLTVLALLFGIAIAGLVISLIMRKSIISRNEMIGYLAVTVFLVVFFLYLPDLINSINWLLGGGYAPSDGNATGGTGDASDIGFGFPIGGILILIMALGMVAYFLISRTAYSLRATAKAKRTGGEKGELLRHVEDAIQDLKSGGDPREIVIRCYRNLCALLGDKGIAPKPHLTPREFENLVIRRTGLRNENLRELTGLFEEARYSNHELNDMDRDHAVNCLMDFRTEIERIGVME